MNLPAMIPLRVLAEEVDVVADEAAIWGMDDPAYPGVRFVLQVRNALLPLTPERIRVIRDYCDLMLEEEPLVAVAGSA